MQCAHGRVLWCLLWLAFYRFYPSSFRVTSLTPGQPYGCPNAINTLRPRQNGRHFADDAFKPIFLNENIRISIRISLKFVPEAPIKNIPALVQIIAWRRPGDKPLSEPMMDSFPTHICVTRPQWVKATLTDMSKRSHKFHRSSLYNCKNTHKQQNRLHSLWAIHVLYMMLLHYRLLWPRPLLTKP